MHSIPATHAIHPYMCLCGNVYWSLLLVVFNFAKSRDPSVCGKFGSVCKADTTYGDSFT